MEQIRELAALLQAFPLWNGQPLQIDGTGAQPNRCGLFPVGEEVLRRRQDVTGGVALRLRQRYILRRVTGRGEEAAAWVLSLQQWLLGKQLTAFGGDCLVQAEKGRLAKAGPPGTDTYEITITVEYTKEYDDGNN